METKHSAPEPDLYLIAHKVRGEPAFDIAHRLMIGDEEGWIIPTSGHRAYPVAYFPLSKLAIEEHPHNNPLDVVWALDFSEAPDHYETTAAKGQGAIRDLLSALGLPRTKPPVIKRRI